MGGWHRGVAQSGVEGRGVVQGDVAQGNAAWGGGLRVYPHILEVLLP